MKKLFKMSAVFMSVLFFASMALPCSLSVGYFHQVTRLRGSVVGVNKGDFRQIFRWMRQRVMRNDVSLTLYQYRWPVSSRSELPLVKTIRTDASGYFDFGPLKDGHYSLVIDDPWGGSDWFDVEVLKVYPGTYSITIDISPVYPDCKGGHEFIVTYEKL